jgi:hypothetical protein
LGRVFGLKNSISRPGKKPVKRLDFSGENAYNHKASKDLSSGARQWFA